MKAQNIEILKSVGLKGTDSKAYLTLLELGKSTAGTIAEKSHLHRRNTYDALESLLQKGLVTYAITNGKKFWSAVHPERLLSVLKENQSIISTILPDLITDYGSTKAKRTVEVFEGLGGMKSFFNDMIKTKREIFMMFATGKAYQFLPHFMQTWDKRLNEEKIHVKVLLNADANKKPYGNYKFGKVKILPRNFSTPTQIFMYGDKSTIAIWSEDPIATVITSKEITDGFKKHFNFLWEFAKSPKK